MEVSLKNKILIIKHKLKNSETYKINKGRKYDSISIYKKPTIVQGIASYCADGKHVLFMDYDNCPLWLIKEDYKRLQDKYGLPMAYLFTTKEKKENGEKIGNYHVICLAKFYPKKIYEIISKTHADVNFMSMPLRNKYRNWILRISNKGKRTRPKFVEMIGEDSNYNYQISKSHFNLLKNIYPNALPKCFKWNNQDNLNKIYFQEYETLNM